MLSGFAASAVLTGRNIQEGKREIILHMLSLNQSPETISELTGEPLTYIEELNSWDK